MVLWWRKKKDQPPEETGEGSVQEEKIDEISDSAEPLEPEPEVPEAETEEVKEVAAEGEESAPKQGFFARLKNRLSKTKTNIIGRVRQVIRLHGKVDEELLEEIEEILIQADVGVETTMKIVDEIRAKSDARGIEDPEEMIVLFKDVLKEIIQKNERLLEVGPQRPFVILVVGVNGTGKTTTIGKLARQFQSQGLSTMLVAADTFRAAAMEQLEIWAERTGSRFARQAMGADPASVCYDALNSAKSKKADVVLIDTAGRLHTKVNLMAELEKVVRVIRKVMPDAPHETLLVLDATTGQNAVSQMSIFSKAVPVTGVIMTKLDGTAKGGILIAVRDLFDAPILKIGIGEKAEDLRDFNPGEFVDALFEE